MQIRTVGVGAKTLGFIVVGVVVATMSLAAVLTGRTAQAFAGGDGSQGSPYEITSCTELLDIANNLDAYYVLAGSIDCTGVTYTPIGTSSSPFSGNVDGKGNTISNVTVTGSASDVGIFGYTEEATITDITISDVGIQGASNVGVLVGNALHSTFSYIRASDSGVSGSGSNIGGLVGLLGGSGLSESYIRDSTVVAATGTGGGLVGWVVGGAGIADVYAGNMTVSGGNTIGGLAGKAGAGPVVIARTYASGTMSAAPSNGGLIGEVTSGVTVSDSFAAVDLTSSALVGSGGAFGDQQGSVSNIFFDIDVSDRSSCVFSGSASCTGVNSGGSQPNYFKQTSTNAPFDQWDFDDTWYVRTADYPNIRPKTMLQMYCNQPGSTNTSVTASCGIFEDIGSAVTWEIQYKAVGYTDWINRTGQTGDSFSDTITGLLPGTDYYVQFRYSSVLGTGPWGRVEVTTTGASDVDGDTALNAEEFYAPNSGDGNGDSAQDYQQANVTARKGTGSNYMVLQSSCGDNYNLQIGLESGDHKDPAFDYPEGLLAFVGRSCGVGATATFNIYFYGNYQASNYVLRKWNNSVYTTVPGAVLVNTTIGAQSVLRATYQITDGSALDDDGLADGTIVDPVGIAGAVVGAPNTGFGR